MCKQEKSSFLLFLSSLDRVKFTAMVIRSIPVISTCITILYTSKEHDMNAVDPHQEN